MEFGVVLSMYLALVLLSPYLACKKTGGRLFFLVTKKYHIHLLVLIILTIASMLDSFDELPLRGYWIIITALCVVCVVVSTLKLKEKKEVK